jgi:hypothetical protein
MFGSSSPGHAERVRTLLAKHEAPPVLPCSLTLDGDCATVAPVGSLDHRTVPVLDGVLSDLRDRGFDPVLVDLRGLGSIDAAGIRFLARCAEDAPPTADGA